MKLLQSTIILLCILSIFRGINGSDMKKTITRLKQCRDPRPDSCNDVFSDQSRVVVILSSGLEVMCDTETDGGGWTIFQRRINGQLSFYRGWEDYKYGFGDYGNGEFYLGNENIHRITTQRRYELRIDINFNNTIYFAEYARFKIYGEPEGYRLKISGYSGNAGDSLSNLDNMRFSTFDKDLDTYSSSCAIQYKGAWWYSSCHSSNLNGMWGNTEYGVGMNWHTTTGFYLSVNMTEMKFRPIP